MKLKSVVAFIAFSLVGLGLALLVVPAQAQEKKPAPAQVRHTDANGAAALLATNPPVVLDVRTPSEFAAGHIAGATNLNFMSGDFATKLAELDRWKTYLVHCASGRRSTNCLPQLARLGFTNVIHLDGGFKAWEAAGNPVAKP